MASTAAGTLLLVLTIILCASAAAAAGRLQLIPSSPPVRNFLFISKRHVAIYNCLGSGLILAVHCKSGNDDRGIQVVQDGGVYDFAFRPSILLNTLYYCGFSWANGSGRANVYVQLRDEVRCDVDVCQWQVTQESLQGLDASGAVDIVYPWNNTSAA